MALSLANLSEPEHAAPAMVPAAPRAERSEALRLRDGHGRALTDLRLSVTDRCNYRCVYCRTGNEGPQFTELPIAIYTRILRVFVSLGIEKVRLTGGEPLLREGLLDLIRETAEMQPEFSDAPLDIAMTTNGHLLAPMARKLKAAGLKRITVSMDAVDPETFTRITRVPGSLSGCATEFARHRMPVWGR